VEDDTMTASGTIGAAPVARGPELDPRIVALTGETLVELLDRAVARTPDREALVLHHALGDDRWTYRQLDARSRSAASVLAASGVAKGDRVVTWGPNEPWLVAALFGAWRLGAMVVPLDLRMPAAVALRIARRTEPAVVLAAVAQAGAAAGLGAPVLPIDAATLGTPGAPAAAAFPTIAPADGAEIVFTSGTTSDPKGVVLTHGQVVHNARMIAQTGMGRHPDRALGIIPLSHMYGQIVPLFQGLISGSTLVFLHALTPTAIGATLRRERITAITAVPQLAQLLLDGIEAEASRRGELGHLQRGRRIAALLPMRLRRRLFRRVHAALGGGLEIITCGGAFLRPELQEAWELFGVRVAQGYGGTECAAITGHTPRHRRSGTVGRVLAGLEVRIADDGELLVRGPAVMDGYWQAPEATGEVLDADGWLHTGDAARFEEHGEVVILGRTRDRIALPNGLKVYPGDVEVALCDTGVVRAAVVLESAPGRLGAVLVPVDPEAPDEVLGAAVRAANATLGPHQRVSTWRRWPEPDLPRTDNRIKIRRDPVKAWFLEALAAGRSPADAEPAPPVSGPPGNGTRRRSPLASTIRPGGGAGGPGALAGRPGTGAGGLGPAGGTPGMGAGDALEVLCAIVAEVAGDPSAPPLTVTPDTTLASLELDSLRFVTLGLRIEEAFDASLSDEELADAVDIRDLSARAAAGRGRPVPPQRATWAFTPWARLVRRGLDATFNRWLIDLVARPKGSGLDRLSGLDGGFLLCPNHTSHLDAPVVRRVLRSEVRDRLAVAAAADYFFTKPVVGALVALSMGAFPFGRTSDVRASLERVADLTSRGWAVVLFPEGTRALDGRQGPLREGIGLLATATGVPVVPVHIAGAHTILPKGRNFPRHRRGVRVRVRFGVPLVFPPGTPAAVVTTELGAAITALAGQGQAGG
jgi:long-chain acyl-CoA synthetase